MRQSIFATAAEAGVPRERRGSRRPRVLARGIAMLTAGTLLAAAAGGAAMADDIYNTIDGTTSNTALDTIAESMTFESTGEAQQSTTLRLQARASATQPSTTNPDTIAGCNATSANPARFTVMSSDPTVATVSPSEIAFTTCTPPDGTNVTSASEQKITVERLKPGTTTISVKVASTNTAPGGFLLTPATFVVTVKAPPVAKPTISVVVLGIDQENYPKGSPPKPSCVAKYSDGRDVEFPAIVGKAEQGDDGLGEWFGKCAYVESLGATPIVSSKSYWMVDTTAPAVEPILSVDGNRVDPNKKWHRGNVRVQWVVTEPQSPSALREDGCEDEAVLLDTTEKPATFTCTASSWKDTRTGKTLSTSVTVTINRDATEPVVSGTITSPTVEVDGVMWHKGKATIDWEASDVLSGADLTTMKSTVAWAPLDGRTTTLGQGRGQTSRVIVTDVAGNTGAGVIRGINVDGSGPVVSTKVETDAAHDDGTRPWYKDSATVSWTATDPEVTPSERGSGVAGASSGTKTVTTSGPFSVDAEDNVGNAGSSEPIELAIDTQAPEVTVEATREPEYTGGGAAWFMDSVDIRVEAKDPAEGPFSTGSGLEDDPSGEETVTTSGPYTATATDNVGHTTTSDGLDVKIDATAPQVSATLPPAPHNDGTRNWYMDMVAVSVTATDPEGGEGEHASGLRPDSDSGTRTFSTAGTHTFTAKATDNVGYESTSDELSFAVDTTAPKVAMVCPPRDVVKGSSAKAGWLTSDTGSGLATPAVGTVTLNTSVVGSQTATTPLAKDKVGHTATASCSYRVVYAFSGFFSPVDNGGVYNKVKAGSAVPVKFSLGGNQGLQVMSGAPVATPMTCSTRAEVDDIEQTVLAATTSGLKYDALARQYVYTWKSDASMAGTCRKLTIKLADGTSKEALFTFVK